MVIKDIFAGFLLSFSYFSILPIKSNAEFKNSHLKYMLFCFPFVGATLALISIGTYLLLAKLGILSAIIAAIFYMLLYGFLHTEAIADVIDAIYAKHSGKDAYEVIKEPTIGAMGMLYSAAFLVLKTSALAYLFEHKLYFALITIAISSRATLMVLIHFLDFKSSFIGSLKNQISKPLLFICLLLCFATCTALGFYYILPLAILFGFLFIKFLNSKLGFLNGDTLGATLEITELALLIFAFYQID